ncbi:hypothetical protein LM505_13415 [Enterococcus faecalis]|nr:hypothetical protein [Enterococcus faecalis]UER69123.1 hypothetical protein LM505_13415 [Enterococcus faecalis]
MAGAQFGIDPFDSIIYENSCDWFLLGMGSLIVYWSLFLEKKTVFLLAE